MSNVFVTDSNICVRVDVVCHARVSIIEDNGDVTDELEVTVVFIIFLVNKELPPLTLFDSISLSLLLSPSLFSRVQKIIFLGIKISFMITKNLVLCTCNM